MSLGYTLTRVFNLPSWMTPAMTFNNTTALPLLLVQSLSTTGVLESLLMSDADSVSDAVLRAKSYFLVNAMINDSLTFAIGPRLLDGEEAPPKNDANGGQDEADGPSQHAHEPENGLTEQTQSESGPNAEAANEETSLLPNFVVRGEHATYRISSEQGRKGWSHLPQWTQKILGFFSGFLNAPIFGALTGAIIGLAPPLHKAFFGDPLGGGIFTAWLTDSVKNIGELFPTLNIVVVGVKLSSSMREMKRGEDSGAVPWLPMIIVLTVRFVMWPAISISLIYLLASRTSLLDADPMLWFAMMLMPTGPTAMKLTALADVTGSSESEKMSIAKFLSVRWQRAPVAFPSHCVYSWSRKLTLLTIRLPTL